MLTTLFSTNTEIVGLILRMTVGFIIFPHGAQKMLGWFGGYGYTATMGFLTSTAKLPYIIGLSVILLEFVGSLMLIAGLGTRIVALGFIGLMIGIILTSHLQNGFFMNWFGNQSGEGFEYHLLVIGLAVALLIGGAGKYSVDQLIVQ
ncbi:MAG: DoxX family protein [Bacteriovoracaceae bacterium]|nr:DoxX family protein [Bacteroidota bacterium]